MTGPRENYYEHTVTADYVAKVTRAEMRRRFRNPFVVLLLVVQVGILIWATSALIRLGTPLSFLLFAVAVALLYWQTIGMHFRYRAALARMTPVGATFGVEIGSTEIGLSGPSSRSQTAYSMLRGVTRSDDLVVIHYTDGLHAYYPDSVFPQQVIDQLNAAAAYYREN